MLFMLLLLVHLKTIHISIVYLFCLSAVRVDTSANKYIWFFSKLTSVTIPVVLKSEQSEHILYSNINKFCMIINGNIFSKSKNVNLKTD